MLVRLLPLALAVLVLPATDARADTRTADLVRQLQASKDPRVRARSATELGASKDDAAVEPLCGALADKELLVRGAAAIALGKLAKIAALPCLGAAAKREVAPQVSSSISASMVAIVDAIDPDGTTPPAPGPGTRFYASLTVRIPHRPELRAVVRKSIERALLANPAFAFAPEGTSGKAMSRVASSGRVKTLRVVMWLERPEVDGTEVRERGSAQVSSTTWTAG